MKHFYFIIALVAVVFTFISCGITPVEPPIGDEVYKQATNVDYVASTENEMATLTFSVGDTNYIFNYNMIDNADWLTGGIIETDTLLPQNLMIVGDNQEVIRPTLTYRLIERDSVYFYLYELDVCENYTIWYEMVKDEDETNDFITCCRPHNEGEETEDNEEDAE